MAEIASKNESNQVVNNIICELIKKVTNENIYNSDLKHIIHHQPSTREGNYHQDLKFLISNVRGFYSKRECLQNIVNKNNFHFVAVTETHTSSQNIPKLSNYKSYFRNRDVRMKGGLCLFVRNDISVNVVKVWEGLNENEVICVVINQCVPKLAVFLSYGTQANSFGRMVPEQNIREIFGKMDNYINDGYECLWIGDQNLKVGRDLVPNNDMIMDPNGALFNDMVRFYKLSIANNLQDDPTTFCDLKTGTKRALDLVITTTIEKITDFTIDDDDRNMTPYSVKVKNDKVTRCYTDHKAVTLTYSTVWRDTTTQQQRKTLWQYNTPLGDQKYNIFTNDGYEYLVDVICDYDISIDEVSNKINEFIYKCKRRSYKIKSHRKRSFDKFMDSEVWKERMEQLEALEKQLAEDKDTDKIFKAKAWVDNNNRDESVSSLKCYKTGELLEDINDIFSCVIEYNNDNMAKNTPSDEVNLLNENRYEVLQTIFNRRGTMPQTISWSTFMNVTRKIMKQHKAVFRDFCSSGPLFKIAMFLYMNRIYSSENIPNLMYTTVLTKLYKKKGDRGDIKNYRFIHGKTFDAKLLEKCLVNIVTNDIDAAVPDSQIGGMANRSTRDHIQSLVSLMKVNERLKKPTITLLVDVARCFDKLPLLAAMADSADTGADPKALYMINKLSDKINIKIAGDVDQNRQIEINDSLGQGTNFANKAASLTIGKGVDECIPKENCDKIADLVIDPKTFVDDVSVNNKDPDSTRQNAILLSKMLESICLNANANKSCVIVSGINQAATAARADLNNNKPRLHSENIDLAHSDAYLGFIVSQEGFQNSVKLTSESRINKGWAKSTSIKSIINSPQLKHFGWFRAAKVLIQATLPSTLTYSCENWIGCHNYIIDKVEKSFKAMVYSILEVPEKTKYSAVLLETGLLRMKFFIHQLQLSYVNKIMWEYPDIHVRRTLIEERNMIGKHSTLDIIDTIAATYNLPPISKHHLDKKFIKQQVRGAHDKLVWTECFLSSIVKSRPYFRIRDKSFMGWNKIKVKALFAWRTGALRFKKSWRMYNTKRGMGIGCVMCNEGDDEWQHMIVCKHYHTKFASWMISESQIADYVVEVNRERFVRMKMPLI